MLNNIFYRKIQVCIIVYNYFNKTSNKFNFYNYTNNAYDNNL